MKPEGITVMDVFLLPERRGKTGRKFFYFAPKNLYRAKPFSDPRRLALLPTFKDVTDKDKNGPRKDIVQYPGDDNMMWVEAGTGGVSLMDSPLKGNGREQLYLPEGTRLPHGLVVSLDGRNKFHQANHYTIHPLTHMHKDTYLDLLERLTHSLKRPDSTRR